MREEGESGGERRDEPDKLTLTLEERERVSRGRRRRALPPPPRKKRVGRGGGGGGRMGMRGLKVVR